MDEKFSHHAFTKKSIYEALMILMQGKPLRELTITEITRSAGVSRMAYYRNFESKEAILLNYIDDLFFSYIQTLKSNGDCTVHSFIVTALTIFRKNALLMREISKENLEAVLIKQFEGYLEVLSGAIFLKTHAESFETRYYASFIAGGAATMVLRWVADGMVQNEAEMALMILDFVNNEKLLNLSQERDKALRCFLGNLAACDVQN